MSRVFDALRRAEAIRTRPRPLRDPQGDAARRRLEGGGRACQVLAVASNKGGVGKTTLATNLAVSLRAMREDLPVLFLSLDDQTHVNGMFALEPAAPGRDVAGAIRGGRLDGAIQTGRYGVHYVPSSADASSLKREVYDPFLLRSVLDASGWRGIVVIDTKSDFEILTQNAIAASDLTLVVIKDQSSLHEARRVYELLESWRAPQERARIVLSLVDRRIKFTDPNTPDVLALLLGEIRERRYPLLETFVSRSPSVEALLTNPDGRPLSILHGAKGSLVHRQMTRLAADVLEVLGPGDRPHAALPGEPG